LTLVRQHPEEALQLEHDVIELLPARREHERGSVQRRQQLVERRRFVVHVLTVVGGRVSQRVDQQLQPLHRLRVEDGQYLVDRRDRHGVVNRDDAAIRHLPRRRPSLQVDVGLAEQVLLTHLGTGVRVER
jgi:hypothetical protein